MYNNINKISANVLNISTNLHLIHCVKVAHRDRDGKREYAHKEYQYNSFTSYSDIKMLSSIKLNFESYLLIEDSSCNWTDKNSIRITNKNLHLVVKHIKQALNWFTSDKYKDLYFYEDGKLKINKEFSLVKETKLSFDQLMIIKPAIVNVDELDYEGVYITINNEKCGDYVTLDDFQALYYILKHTNLYTLGLLMMNYLQRPAYGKYLTVLGDLEQNRYVSSNVNSESITVYKGNLNKEDYNKEYNDNKYFK